MADPCWTDTVASRYHTGHPLALMFDFDGTLAPIVAHPSLVALPPRTRDILAALAERDDVAVGVISGRPLGLLKELVGLDTLYYAGSGGMHIDLGDTQLIDAAAEEFDQAVDAILLALSDALRLFPGTWVERKPGCLSIHYRQLDPRNADRFREEIHGSLQFLAHAAPRFRVLDVTRAFEISLAGAWSKGDAVDRILSDLSPNPFSVYAGDGTNDLEAFVRVDGRNGVTIGVGPEAPCATKVRVPTPEALAAYLDRLLGKLSRCSVTGNGVCRPSKLS